MSRIPEFVDLNKDVYELKAVWRLTGDKNLQ